MSWVDVDACTLPTADQPLRVAEFDALFGTALRGLTRRGPTRLELVLDGTAEVEATARDLVARESACCGFFSFDLDRSTSTAGEETLRLDVQVPAPYVGVLDGLAARAANAAGVAGAGA